MKIFELAVTETFMFRFFLPLSNKETLLSHTKNEKIFHNFSQKPIIETLAPN